MKYGIIIVALGYPLYGNCAFNLALSLKATSKDVPIALVYEESSIEKLTKRELSYFDHFIKLSPKWYTVQGTKQYQRVKLCVNQFTNELGWDYTIYMDADNIWLDKPVDYLFGKLAKKDFHIGCNGQYDVKTKKKTNPTYTYWPRTSEKAICDYHKVEKILPQTVSGFLFFKNGPKADETFRKSLVVYDDPKAPTITWANGKPDEYCMNVALGQEGYTQEPDHIFYFDKINGTLSEEAIEKRFWGIATGGNKVSPKLVHLYNRKVNTLCINEKIDTRHFHVDKHTVITERKEF
jgi:hypothetical protein